MDELENLDEKQTETESSTVQPDEKAEAAESSTVAKEEEASLTALIEKATAGGEKATEGETEEEETEESEDAEGEGGKKGEEDEAEKEGDENPDAKLPFHKHPRFQELVTEKNTLRQQVEQDKPFSDYGKGIVKFCQDNQVSSEDLQVAFELVALAKKDVKAFEQKLVGILETVQVSSGNRLPADLQKKVADGVIDEESARELAQARLAVQQGRRGQESAQLTQQQLLQRNITDSLNVWEQSKKKTDPDYDKRSSLLSDRYLRLAAQKPPQASGEAVALAEQAYKEITESLKAFAPKRPVRKVLAPSSTKGANGDAEVKINSLDDLDKLTDMVLAKHR